MDFHELAERDHELQDPTSEDKIRLLGEYLRLGPHRRVLDVACGKAEAALVLARTFGCRITGVELRPAFATAARARIAAAGLESLADVQTADAKTFPLEPRAWDAALCIGASFVCGRIADAAAMPAPAVKAGGFVGVGKPYWRRRPLPSGVDADSFVPLTQTTERFVAAGLALTGLVGANEDDWNRHESLHRRAPEE